MEPVKGYTRSGQAEALGLYTYTCAICGKKFEATTQHAYKIVQKNKAKMYCCYKHFRIDDEKVREEYKQAMFGRWTTKADTRSKVASAQKRVDTCQKRIEAAQAKINDPMWDAMTTKQQKRAKEQAAYWQARLVVAETELEEAMMLAQ